MNKKVILYSLLAVLLAAILFTWWPISGRMLTRGVPQALISISNFFALLAVLSVLLELVLIGRVKWVESAFGLDKLSRVHHWVGIAIPGFLLVHIVFLTIGFSMQGKTTFINQFIIFLTRWEDVLNAAIAALLFGIIVLFSTLLRKKFKYEPWYFIHLLMYAAILLAFGHQLAVGRDLQTQFAVVFWWCLYVFAFGNLVVYRFLFPIVNSIRHDFTVDKAVKETDDVYSIYIVGKNIDEFKVKAGQFMIMRFLDGKRWWQAHPFSLSCAPNGKYIRITFKKSGDYTMHLDSIKPGTKVLIDGPHGVFAHKKLDKVLYIAGGIGIAPIFSLAESGNYKNAILMYGNRTEDLPLGKELRDIDPAKFKMHAFIGDKKVDDKALAELVPDVLEREVYLCGPVNMVDSICKILDKQGVPPNRIHFERFAL
ncbi:MAG: ferredoxin reductase family protein [Patescibacteria group bacterium]|jgi:predicted ferric reductase